MVQNYNGTPIDFGHSVEFYCASSDLYYEHDRDLQTWKLNCMPGGMWDVPQVWPRCVKSKNFLWSELKTLEWDIRITNIQLYIYQLD